MSTRVKPHNNQRIVADKEQDVSLLNLLIKSIKLIADLIFQLNLACLAQLQLLSSNLSHFECLRWHVSSS